MAGETMAYEAQTALTAVCSSEGQRLEAHTEDVLDDIVAGHLMMTHGWTKAAATAYVAAKTYTPPVIQGP